MPEAERFDVSMLVAPRLPARAARETSGTRLDRSRLRELELPGAATMGSDLQWWPASETETQVTWHAVARSSVLDLQIEHGHVEVLTLKCCRMYVGTAHTVEPVWGSGNV